MSYLRLLGDDFDNSINTNQISAMFSDESVPNQFVNFNEVLGVGENPTSSVLPFNSNVIDPSTDTTWQQVNLNDAGFINSKPEPTDDFFNWEKQSSGKKRKAFEAFPLTTDQHMNPPNPLLNTTNLQLNTPVNIATNNAIPQWLAQNLSQSQAHSQQNNRGGDLRTHCDRLLTEQPGTKKQRLFLNLTFDQVPDFMFDTTIFPVKQLISISDHQPQDEMQLMDVYKDLFFYVAPVNICEGKFVDMDFQQLDIDANVTFGYELYKKLPAHKVFVLWVQVWSYSSNKMIIEGASQTITLLHDGLKETPPQITADVCFFPQKVVIAHLKNCNSKATLSKRHKKGKIKEGSTWCRNPKNCASKGSCGCQAYPSRILKKGIRELKLLLERSEAPAKAIQNAAELYAILSQTADKQTEKIPGYESFLKERIKRWKLFMKLKEYVDSGVASKDVVEKFRFIYGLLPNPEGFADLRSKQVQM